MQLLCYFYSLIKITSFANKVLRGTKMYIKANLSLLPTVCFLDVGT